MYKLIFLLFLSFFSTGFAESIPVTGSPWSVEYTEDDGLIIKENNLIVLQRQPEDVGFFLKARTIRWGGKKFLLASWEAGQAMYYELLDPTCKNKSIVATGRSIDTLETRTTKKAILITYTTTTDDDVGMMLSPRMKVTQTIQPSCDPK